MCTLVLGKFTSREPGSANGSAGKRKLQLGRAAKQISSLEPQMLKEEGHQRRAKPNTMSIPLPSSNSHPLTLLVSSLLLSKIKLFSETNTDLYLHNLPTIVVTCISALGQAAY